MLLRQQRAEADVDYSCREYATETAEADVEYSGRERQRGQVGSTQV
jgi:hypothetical protein